MSISPALPIIAVLGGTGKEGKGLAYRWAKAGYRVLIGSRTPLKGAKVARELNDLLGGNSSIEGTTYVSAVDNSDIIVLSVPFSSHRLILESLKTELKGKILIDVTVPIVPGKETRVKMPSAGSALQEAREILGKDTQLTSAFQNISSVYLFKDAPVNCDVLVTGTDKEARSLTLKLVEAAGFTGWDAGPIENSAVVEGLTSVLININKLYGSRSAGFRITGVKRSTQNP